MTNLEAFNKGLIIKDDGLATIVLNSKSIDPTGEDDNELSLGWGYIYSVTAADYSQGKTSEKLTSSAIRQRMTLGKQFLANNGVIYNDSSAAKINPINW